MCLTIFLDAIERFVNIPEVENPQLVLIVGGVGLAFNILGLFVFHQHDHGDHGDHDHEHEEEDGHTHDHSHAHHHDEVSQAEEGTLTKPSHKHASSGETQPILKFADPQKPAPTYGSFSSARRRRISGSEGRRSRALSDAESMPTHPRMIRQQIIDDARVSEATSDNSDDQDGESAVADGHAHSHEHSPLLAGHRSGKQSTGQALGVDHKDHKHNTSKREQGSHGHGHSHADMNIRGMFLHVLGDALGNVGVMASALIIWLATDWKERFYVDPAISIIITFIILKSAIPLVLDTSKPLLQAVPSHISVDEIREDIETLPGIRNCHHVHVWALTPSKPIATLDVELDFNFEGRNASRYMDLAKEIKLCLRGHGIHSSTIQPEFCTNTHHDHDAPGKPQFENGAGAPSTAGSTVVDSDASRTNSGLDGCGDGTCLLQCDDGCGRDKQCCGASAHGGDAHSAHSGENNSR